MNCIICTDTINPQPITGWDKGHNAEPIKEGRCCEDCNSSIVVPARFSGLVHYEQALSLIKENNIE